MILEVLLAAAAAGSGSPPTILSVATATITTGTAVEVTKPTGVASGDLLLAFCTSQGSTTWTGDTGFTEVRDVAGAPTLRVAYKVAGGSEPATYTFTAFSSGAHRVVLAGIRGGTYTAISATTGTATSGGNCAAPSVTAAAGSSLLLAFFVINNSGSSGSFPDPTGMTSEYQSTDSRSPDVALFSEVVAAGATGTRSSDHTSASGDVKALLVVIAPS